MARPNNAFSPLAHHRRFWGFERGEGGQPLDFTFKVPVAIPDQVDQMEAFLGFTAADLFAAAAGIGTRMQV